MTNIYKNYDERMFRLGLQISKASFIPTTGTHALFTVSGGDILVTSLVGEVTKVFDASVTTLKAHFDPTEATATHADLSIASAGQNAAPVGRHYHLPATAAGAITADGADKSGYVELLEYLLLPPGTLNIVAAVGQTAVTGGTLKWDMTYIPLSDAAAVAAA